MATITSAAIGLLGSGANIASAVRSNKLQKESQKAAKIAAQNLRSIKEQNPFEGVQVPTMASKQAMDLINQQASDSMAALQGAGAEGVIGGTAGLNKSVRDAALDVAANQEQMQYQRDAMQADAQSGINQRQADREFDTELMALQGAQQAASDAEFNRNQAISGAAAGLAGAVGEFADAEQFDYLGEQMQNKKLKKKLKFKPVVSDADLEAMNNLTPN